jgi:catechol 2,3-dioxygenase-like lactoylglutathione lyase family enzyme
LVGVADTPSDRVRTFFGVDTKQPNCKIGWIRIPGGAVLEIFEFQPQESPIDVQWNRIGLTHVSFNVRGTKRWYDYLVSKGVECVSKPERSPRGHTFFFAKDVDGNLIELMDLGYMHYVLSWLGPLGGFLFRHGRYKRYYL